MTGFFMFLHAIVSIMLLVIILMQSGRGGGLTEGFASAESMFGAKTNEFMIKATALFASLFLITCLGLAVFSAQRGKSLMANTVASEAQEMPAAPEADAIPEVATVPDLKNGIVTGDEEATQTTLESN
jgi:preprotein translocase subunit SecG